MYKYILLLIISNIASLAAMPQLQSFTLLPSFRVELTSAEDSSSYPQLSVTNIASDDKEGDKDRSLFKSSPSAPILSAAVGTIIGEPIHNGNFQAQEHLTSQTTGFVISTVALSEDSRRLNIYGNLTDGSHNSRVGFVLSLYTGAQSGLYLRGSLDITQNSVGFNRLFLNYWCSRTEGFYGFGESFSVYNLRGRNVPILVSEQGVGRGEQPITDYLNSNVDAGVGGYWFTTYAPKAIYITSEKRGMYFGDNAEVMYMNISALGGRLVSAEIWNTTLSARILIAGSVAGKVTEITEETGRMAPIADWSQHGAIVGLEGGTEEVSEIVDKMRKAKVPLAGIWLQDWVGIRHGTDGDRLIWNWELNYDYYPGWHDMTTTWSHAGIRVLTYVNPFFSDPTNFTTNSRRNFFKEGIENGYFVKRSNGEPYKMYSLTIEFCMLDVTNPSAVQWMKQIIQEQLVGEAGSSGWMADFGEYLPFDAVLHSGVPAATVHNLYPQMWADINYEAVSKSSETPVYFMRSAWTKSPKSVPVFWLGDQLISYDANDGLQSVVIGALSSGLTGQSITHSDIGGYNFENISTGNGSYITYVRSQELLMRWSELSSFGSGIFRTHIGSSRTSADAQVYDTEESLQHFAKFADLFAAVAAYRKDLMQEAHDFGYPLMRPLFFHYENEHSLYSVTDEYLFGSEFIITPCMTPGADQVSVTIPGGSGDWIHLWSGFTLCSEDFATKWTVPSAIGFPSVVYKSDSAAGKTLRDYVLEKGYNIGYEWRDYEQAWCSEQLTSSAGLSSTADVVDSGDRSVFIIFIVFTMLGLPGLLYFLARFDVFSNGYLSRRGRGMLYDKSTRVSCWDSVFYSVEKVGCGEEPLILVSEGTSAVGGLTDDGSSYNQQVERTYII